MQDDGKYPALYLGMGYKKQAGRGVQPTSLEPVKMRAARLVCALVNGVPDRWEEGVTELVHLCDNDRCISPLHVVWSTRAVNGSHNRAGQYEQELAKRGGPAYYTTWHVKDFIRRWKDALGASSTGDGDAAAAEGQAADARDAA